MRYETFLLAVFLSLPLFDVAEAQVLDQLLEPDPVDALKGVQSAQHAQTFTVGIGGTLDSADVLVRRFGSPNPLLVDIRGTVGGVPIEDDGMTLAAVSLPSLSVPTVLTWVSVDVSSFNIPVQVGDVLAIVLRTVDSGAGGYQWGAEQGNPYLGGAPYFRNPGPNWTLQTEDSGFRTFTLPTPGFAAVFPLDPADAYIHVASTDTAGDPTPIDLAAEGFVPGDVLRVRRVGDYVGVSGGPDNNTSLLGVFSASDVLLSQSLLNRVQGALAAPDGVDFATLPTFPGNEPTDIPEDFFISGGGVTDSPPIWITVPAGATHLFVAAPDNLYGDNTDPNGDFGVEIIRVGAFFSVDPADAYIHVASTDTAGAPTPIDLAAEGFVPGDVLQLKRAGDFVGVSGGPDNNTSLLGVFSASGVLLGQSLLNRVQDALAAPDGRDFATLPTFPGNEPTDIPEDFFISGRSSSAIWITVPAGATHLFVAAPDNLYGDNTDPNGDFGVEIIRVGALFSLDPADAYIHVAATDTAGDPVPIELAGLNIASGDSITVSRIGDFVGVSGGPDNNTSLLGVFSASGVLLGQSLLNRVQDALAAPDGVDFATLPTFPGNEPTDIPEDFFISVGTADSPPIWITVPDGPTHLFAAVPDNLYGDNTDPDGDFGVIVVPEPGWSLLLLSGVAWLLLLSRLTRPIERSRTMPSLGRK